MLAGILYAVGGFIELLIGLRFLFRLLGANGDSSFVHWIYSWSTPLVTPFAGIFGQEATVTGPGVAATSVFDWTALIALVIDCVIIAVITRIVGRAH
ncbi:MAG: YggT family protein [Candidatus Saccharimonadales bacterium]